MLSMERFYGWERSIEMCEFPFNLTSCSVALCALEIIIPFNTDFFTCFFNLVYLCDTGLSYLLLHTVSFHPSSLPSLVVGDKYRRILEHLSIIALWLIIIQFTLKWNKSLKKFPLWLRYSRDRINESFFRNSKMKYNLRFFFFEIYNSDGSILIE